MERFAAILYDLGKEIGLNLYPDTNQICELHKTSSLITQIQYDEPQELVLISTFVAEIPPGKYREKVLMAGLTYNGQFPRTGTFAFSSKNNQLAFFTKVGPDEQKPDLLFARLEKFLATANEWKNAIEGGKPLPLAAEKQKPGDGMFGLKP